MESFERSRKTEKKAWFKLDNAAKIYPPTQSKNWMAMFRLSATLSEEVDEKILKETLEDTLRRFPSFACRLRRGLFWYYFDAIEGIPPIEPDVRNPMAYLRAKENRYFLFRVRVDRCRISVEFFHALTDGTGGMTFLLALVREYLQRRYHCSIPGGKYLLSCTETPCPEESEDSFLRYARRETVSRRECVAYHPGGTAVPLHRLLLISGTVPTDRLHEVARSYHVSVGVFLTALLIRSVATCQKCDPCRSKRRRAVKVSVPVNLRRFYPTKTLRNFSYYVNPGIETRLGEYTFEEILTQVRSVMEQKVTEKQLNACISENVRTEKNWAVRLLPLALKVPIMKLAFLLQGDRYVSSTLTNLGQINLPDEMRSYVRRVDFMLGQPSDRRSVCACVSYENRTMLTFSRTVEESEVERYFFTDLIKMGIPVRIESNGRDG